MIKIEPLSSKLSHLIYGVLIVLCLGGAVSMSAIEEKLDLLQIGTNGYRNVTVTSKTESYILILHSRGMTSIKVKDLPREIKERLGYSTVARPPSARDNPTAWAKQEISKLPAKLPLSQVPAVEQLNTLVSESVPRVQSLSRKAQLMIVGAILLTYLGFCYCCQRICKKAGGKPGVAVWIPLVHFLPLLRAASMSPVWIIPCLLPLLNLVVYLVWSIKIVRACGKKSILAFLFLLPGPNLFAFMYLAFSSRAPQKESRAVEVMTLEAA